ncbi:MAG: AAC(3) family N-acetyltransferase [Lachnospiraceae bacterium]|jgi:aminoglycoside 3-N-acetyltransferase|nr:AAC(3) family N-acetyltransferase [Lachnospiraceae bacterium]
MTDITQFKKDLRQLGVCAGDTLLVHSSMKALGTNATPDAIIDALEEVLGEDGTLLMPALTYETVNTEHPVFESAKTLPCIGLLPTVFMQRPGTERSLHPTHSVCAKGRLAHTLTVRHAMDQTAVGPRSPFMLLPLYKGKLLFIGDILDKCTFMHGIEDLVKPPYIRPEFPATYMVDGEKREYIGGHDFGWGAEFQRIEELLEEPDLRKGKLLAANAYLIDTRALLAAAVYKMRCEPYAFVTDISSYI